MSFLALEQVWYFARVANLVDESCIIGRVGFLVRFIFINIKSTSSVCPCQWDRNSDVANPVFIAVTDRSRTDFPARLFGKRLTATNARYERRGNEPQVPFRQGGFSADMPPSSGILSSHALNASFDKSHCSVSLRGDGFVVSDHDDGKLLILIQGIQ